MYFLLHSLKDRAEHSYTECNGWRNNVGDICREKRHCIHHNLHTALLLLHRIVLSVDSHCDKLCKYVWCKTYYREKNHRTPKTVVLRNCEKVHTECIKSLFKHSDCIELVGRKNLLNSVNILETAEILQKINFLICGIGCARRRSISGNCIYIVKSFGYLCAVDMKCVCKRICNSVEYSEKNKERNNHRKTAACRLYALFFIELIYFFLCLLSVIFIFFLNFLLFFGKSCGTCHWFLLFDCKRKHTKSYNNCKDDNWQSEIFKKIESSPQHIAEQASKKTKDLHTVTSL